MKKTKVALVDDHVLFRDGICELINGYNNFEVVVEAGNGEELVKALTSGKKADIVLLDINMKVMDGFETAAWLKLNFPSIQILALSMYEDEQMIIRMLRLGAKGYILKDIRKNQLLDALQMLVEKGYYYNDSITGKLMHAINTLDDSTLKTDSVKDLISLNQREIDFLKFACSDLTYKEIAEKMNVSPHTIDGYRDNLFEKLNVKSRVGLVLYAVKKKLFIVD